MKTYNYWLVTRFGSTYAIAIDDRSESTANAEAKIEAERWLAQAGMTPADLTRFDLVGVQP